MKLSVIPSWRIVVLNIATLAALVFGILSLRGNHVQPEDDRAEGYRSIPAQLVDERQLPLRTRRARRGSDGTLKRPAEPAPAADGRATTMVLNGQTEAAIQKLRVEAKGGDPEALTNLAAALLTHCLTARSLSDSYEVSITLEAFVAARKAIAQSPAFAAAHFNLALALEQLGFTPEARREYRNAATLEWNASWIAEARRREGALRGSRLPVVSLAAMRYISATGSPGSRAILKEYLDARERTYKRSQWWNSADERLRLERAAAVYDCSTLYGVYAGSTLYIESLQRVFSQAAVTLGPQDQLDLYMQRYLIAGGLYRAGRNGEAVAALRALDADVFQTHKSAGWRAQVICEEAISKIARHSPVDALDLLQQEFYGSVSKRKPWLTALYGNLANEVRTQLLQSALRSRDIPTALAYTDAAVFGRLNGYAGDAHEDTANREIAAKAARLVKYGDVLKALKDCRDGRFNNLGLNAQPEKSPEVDFVPGREAQAALTPNAAIVEYATVHDQLIAFVIRRSVIEAISLYASAADVKSAADAMRHVDDRSFATAAGHLYELIVAPVAARLESLSTIAFVPYRDLAGIPFGALLDVQRGQFMIERFAVVHAQSTHMAITASRAFKPPCGEKVLAIAATDFDHEHFPDSPVLPDARREADSIATLSRCSRLLTGPAATPEAIERQLVENVVIHYAGHIVRRGADVWLPLMPSAGRDGLSATEIAHLSLKNARVVVLAACRGALPGEADDVMPTMADAFLIAGVPAVIASSYDVDDSDAPTTMLRLHTYLHNGDDAAGALRKTTLEELRRGRGVPLSLRFMAIGGAVSLTN